MVLCHCHSCKDPVQIFPIPIIPVSPPLHLGSAASKHWWVPFINIEACIKYLTFLSKGLQWPPAWHISQAILHSSSQYLACHSKNRGWHSTTCTSVSKRTKAGLPAKHAALPAPAHGRAYTSTWNQAVHWQPSCKGILSQLPSELKANPIAQSRLWGEYNEKVITYKCEKQTKWLSFKTPLSSPR